MDSGGRIMLVYFVMDAYIGFKHLGVLSQPGGRP
jgi:hypothetical protein